MGCSSSKSTAIDSPSAVAAPAAAAASTRISAHAPVIAETPPVKLPTEDQKNAAVQILQRYHRGNVGRAVAKTTKPPGAWACPCYRVDIASETFGACLVCGFAKAGHTEKAIAAGKGKGTTRANSAELRAKMVQRTFADCTHFRVSMDPSLPFGTCVCGKPRAEHTEEALAAGKGKGTTRANSAELRAKMVQRCLADCTHFRVSMDPSLPFGTCGSCGRPRAEHTEEALAADADHNSGKRLVRKASADVRREMEAKQEEIGTAVETQGAKTGVAFGLGNTVRTAAEEQAAVSAAINARAGGADKAAALNEFNEMMKEAAAPAAASA